MPIVFIIFQLLGLDCFDFGSSVVLCWVGLRWVVLVWVELGWEYCPKNVPLNVGAKSGQVLASFSHLGIHGAQSRVAGSEFGNNWWMAPRIPLKSVKAIQAYRGAKD